MTNKLLAEMIAKTIRNLIYAAILVKEAKVEEYTEKLAELFDKEVPKI